MKFHKLKNYLFDIGLVLISAILLILSFLPVAHLEFLAWFAFLPLFFALKNKKPFYGFLLSNLCGIFTFSGVIYWLINVTFVGLIFLVLYLALYFGIFGLIITRYSILDTRYSIFVIPSIWVALEYIRSQLFTGFGWALLGYSQYLNLPIIQIVNITGIWGVSFLVMMINVLIYSVIGYRLSVIGKKKIILTSILGISCILVTLIYGHYKLHRAPSTEHRTPIKISVVQPNIPQSIKWQEYAKQDIWEQYLSLTQEALEDNPDLIIWPESALPGVLKKDPYIERDLKAFVSNIQIPLLVGVVNSEKDNYYNSAILISKKGEFIQRYDKLHLVPFGEYIPLKRIFGFLETIVPIGDFIPGKEYTIFDLGDSSIRLPVSLSARQTVRPIDQQTGRLKFSVLICFEDIFPRISRQFVKKGADFLINITNDAWFGNTSSPYQHLSASVFRAIENSVYLIRAANTGISGFITPTGRVYPLIDNDSGRQTFISGYKAREVYISHKQNTFYTQWGDWFVLVCGLIVIFGIVKVKGKMKPRHMEQGEHKSDG